jgi:uncharacterized protein
MSGGWPSTIDPVQLADQGAHLRGELLVRGMARLVAMCLSDEGTAHVDLKFERSQGDGVRTLRGTIDVRLRMTCQRCLMPFDLDVHSDPELLLLRPGERDDLADTGDVLVVEQPVALSDIVEDELLLVMPMIPMHDADQCPATTSVQVKTKIEKETRQNPFSVLENLKRTDR